MFEGLLGFEEGFEGRVGSVVPSLFWFERGSKL